MLLKDFEFIGEEVNDEVIKNTDKLSYKKMVKEKVKKAAVKCYIKRKEEKLSKLDKITYNSFMCQPYLSCPEFGTKEIKLMGLLRSKCHPSKSNFKKMNQNRIQCSLGCSAEESQFHVFEECKPILDKLGLNKKIRLDNIYGTLEEQKSILPILMQIEAIQIDLNKTLIHNTV